MREGWVGVQGERVSFERERGVSAITVSPEVAYLVVRVPQPERITEQRQHVLNLLREAEIPIFLIKLQRYGISFGVNSEHAALAQHTLEAQGFQVTVKPRRVMVSVYAQNMRELHGVVAKIAEVLYEAGVAIEQLSDAHDRITCLIQAEQAPLVVERLRAAFQLPTPTENALSAVAGNRHLP
ncbi:MAG: ACT domain-containing protein [Fimbriimonadales bacterium]|nr:ACT domain-containing protein [Fimbriimonadales bacterium]MDW8052121.1 ACT domain-containing protein [Armatimonadota bacterium]